MSGEAKHLSLLPPFDGAITQSLDTNAPRQAAFNGGLDEVRREERQRDDTVYLAHAAAIPTPLEPLTKSQSEPQVIPAKDIQKQDTGKEKQLERQAEAEKQKKAVERERRHKRYAEKKARQEAAREQQQQLQQAQLQQHEREMRGQARPFGILAFDDGDEPAAKSGFYGD